MKTRTLGWLAVVLVITTVIWVGTTIATEIASPPAPTLAAKIAALDEPDALFYVTYLNAALITLLTVALFTGLYLTYRRDYEFWASIAAAFLPVYGTGNLVTYLSQILVVPRLLVLHRTPETAEAAEVLLELTLQNWPGSAVGALNLFSYAVLGIPSIVFGRLLAREAGTQRTAGLLLAISGGLSILALIGLALNSPVLTSLTLVSGVVFLVAVILLAIRFLSKPA